MNVKPEYKELAGVFQDALDQAQNGKGKERHAKDDHERFVDQQILEISRRQDNLSGLGFQAHKKLYEAEGMFSRIEYKKARHELLGALAYTAAMVIRIDELAERGLSGWADKEDKPMDGGPLTVEDITRIFKIPSSLLHEDGWTDEEIEQVSFDPRAHAFKNPMDPRD